jgi:hypothetical protein
MEKDLSVSFSIKTFLYHPADLTGLALENAIRKTTKWELNDDNKFQHPIHGTGKNKICLLVNDCDKFINKCINGDNLSYCTNIIKDPFSFCDFLNFPHSEEFIAKFLEEINPDDALAVLKRFQFGYHTVSKKVGGINNFTVDVVQDVNSWLKNLINNTDNIQDKLDCNCNKVKDFIKAVSKNQRFLNFLHFLVEYVNANEQALNREIAKKEKVKVAYPNINPNYSIYDYVNPYVQARGDLYNLLCGLTRLRTDIINKVQGLHSSSLMGNLHITGNISMPFTRTAFTYPTPFWGPWSNFAPTSPFMVGGNSEWRKMYDETAKIYEAYGYQFFNNIFIMLDEFLDQLTQGMKLSPQTKDKIDQKIKTLKDTEEKLRKELATLLERKVLYERSYRNIDAFRLNDEELEKAKVKHPELSTLIGNYSYLTNVYNKRAINLIDIFSTIAEKILKEAETKSYRPLSEIVDP